MLGSYSMAKHPFDHLIELLADKIGQAMAANAPAAARKGKPAAAGRRKMSAAGIERIRAAAKKRWAKWRKAKGG
jgi:hypothetical protein